ncbi:hypothetical protein ACOMHN_042784 [Nucella lapillus]
MGSECVAAQHTYSIKRHTYTESAATVHGPTVASHTGTSVCTGPISGRCMVGKTCRSEHFSIGPNRDAASESLISLMQPEIIFGD